MEALLLLSIATVGVWTTIRLVQVRRLTLRFEQVRHRNLEQDRPFKG